MNEKKWTDDERDEAFDRGMETMQRVALELYRRGREPLLEELETVKRERDEALADLTRSVAAWESAGMQGRTAHDAMLALAKERDEARAEAGRLREMAHDFEAMREDRAKAWQERDELIRVNNGAAKHGIITESIRQLAELLDIERKNPTANETTDSASVEIKRLRDAILRVQTSESAPAWFADGFHDGWKAGAEAMREACARWMSEREGIAQWVYDDALSALPIPEEP